MRVQLINKPTTGVTGISRYITDLKGALQQQGAEVTVQPPPPPPIPFAEGLRKLGFDVQAFFNSYPLRAQLDGSDVYHIATQTMGTILLMQRFPAPVVVTVHDIIPWLVRHDPELNVLHHRADRFFFGLALRGLHRADALIAISEYTRRTLIDALHLPTERIHVVYQAIDHQRFRPVDVPDEFYARYGLDRDHRYLLYVGSEDPRKNVATLIHALARLRSDMKDVKFLKVGKPHFTAEREHLLNLIDVLGLQDAVCFIDQVPDDDLVLFYNAADVFVMPSRFEGFGYPVIEAMACGTPAVVANATSLPELVGDLTPLIDPLDPDAMAAAIAQQLTHPLPPEKWIERAAQFTLDRTASQTLSVYQAVTG